MLKNALYHQFSRDLLNLYCRVKESSLEKVFLRFAKEENFSQWLRSHKKDILSSIGNASVYDAFDILIDLQGVNLGDNPEDVPASSLGELLKRFQYSSKSLKTIPIIKTFSTLIDDPSLGSILGPFRNNILLISKWLREQKNLTDIEKSKKEMESQQVVKDLSAINNMFFTQEYDEEKAHVRKPSVTQQRKDMFIYLLTRFSEEAASAFENSGMNDIAAKMKSKILSVLPAYGIGTLMPLKPVLFPHINSVKIMVDYVWKHPDIKWGNYNHDLVEITFLNQAGEISSEDLYFIKSEYEKKKSIDDLLNDSDEIKEGMGTFDKITIDKKMNPSYLQMLSLFFHYYQIKLKI